MKQELATNKVNGHLIYDKGIKKYNSKNSLFNK